MSTCLRRLCWCAQNAVNQSLSHNSARDSLMGRYRAPVKSGSKYITAAGHARLTAELNQLWRVERPQVTAAVSAAAAQGDRSENAEYTYGKRRLREIDSRVRHLRKRLDGMVVVDQRPSDPRRVFFGAWVELERQDGDTVRYRIVGPDEFDMAEGYISMDAPLARALLGKRLDEEIAVSIAGQDSRYVITAIDYR
jgi:transcription elongation factor GreB